MEQPSKPAFFRSLRFRYGLTLAVFLAAVLYLLWDEHKAHILGYGPLLVILLLCGGMHFFHHAHGGGQHGPTDRSRSVSDKGEAP